MRVREYVISALLACLLVWLGNILFDILFTAEVSWSEVIDKSFWACTGVLVYLVIIGVWQFIKLMIKL